MRHHPAALGVVVVVVVVAALGPSSPIHAARLVVRPLHQRAAVPALLPPRRRPLPRQLARRRVREVRRLRRRRRRRPSRRRRLRRALGLRLGLGLVVAVLRRVGRRRRVRRRWAHRRGRRRQLDGGALLDARAAHRRRAVGVRSLEREEGGGRGGAHLLLRIAHRRRERRLEDRQLLVELGLRHPADAADDRHRLLERLRLRLRRRPWWRRRRQRRRRGRRGGGRRLRSLGRHEVQLRAVGHAGGVERVAIAQHAPAAHDDLRVGRDAAVGREALLELNDGGG